MDMTKNLLEPLGLVAVRANSDWIVIRRKEYFDIFLYNEPFTSVEVLWNRAQDTVVARVWGKTMHKTGNAQLAEICTRVFSRKPCFGVWKQDLGSDFLEKLKPCHFPVLRFKSLSCIDWVDDEYDLTPDRITDPITCIRCKEDAIQDSCSKTNDFEHLISGSVNGPLFNNLVENQNGQKIKMEPDVKVDPGGNDDLEKSVDYYEECDSTNDNQDVIMTNDCCEGEQYARDNDSVTNETKIESVFMKASCNREDKPQFNCEVKKQTDEEIQLEADVNVNSERNDDFHEKIGKKYGNFRDYNCEDTAIDNVGVMKPKDCQEEKQLAECTDIITYDIKIESVFMRERPNRKKPKWQTKQGQNMFQLKNWMHYFFPNDIEPICPFCNARKANQNVVRKHVKERHAFSWYKCPMCEYYENLPNHIVEHVEKSHNDDPMLHTFHYECPCCKEMISSNGKTFIAHASNCFKEYRKKVDKSNLMRIKKYDIEKYREMMKRKHPRNDRVRMSEKAYRKRKKKQVFETPRPCEECGKMFDRWFSLNEHKKIHKKFDVPQDCPMCDKKFEYKNSFLQHKKWHRRGERFKCTRCDYRAHSRKGYENHQARHLVEEGLIERVTCSECSKQYNTEWDLEKHMEYAHKDMNYKCTKCDLAFPNAYERSEHVAMVHNTKVFNCEPCLASFHTKQRLSIHNKQVHKTAEEREADKVNCSLCNKILATKATLNYHMKTKHPECGVKSNPVACDKCDRIFYNNRSLYFHKRGVHKTEQEKKAQRAKCDVCEQELSTKGALRYHLQHKHPLEWEEGVKENVFRVHPSSKVAQVAKR